MYWDTHRQQSAVELDEEDIIETTAMEKAENKNENNNIISTTQRVLEVETLIISGALGRLIQLSTAVGAVNCSMWRQSHFLHIYQGTREAAKGRRSRNKETQTQEMENNVNKLKPLESSNVRDSTF